MNRYKAKKTNNASSGKNYRLLPILFVLCIIPLIMRLRIYNPGLSQFAWFPDDNQAYDIFLYYKGVFLVLTAVVMALVLGVTLYRRRKENDSLERLKQAKWLIPLAGFALLAVLSTLFSKYRSYGFHGIHEQFESIWVVLSYCIVTVYTYCFVKTQKDFEVIKKGLFVLLIALGVLGLTQITGHDFWESALGKSLYVPARYASLRDQLSFTFSGSGHLQVYLTFYNPNYVGVFGILFAPISIMLCVGHREWKKRIAWGIASLLVLLCALGCGSRAFLLSFAVTAFFGILIYIRKRTGQIPVLLAGVLVVLIVGGIYMHAAGIHLLSYLKNGLMPEKNQYQVEDFQVEEDHVTLKYSGKTLSMRCEDAGDGSLSFQAWEEDGTELPFTIGEDGSIHFSDERFSDVTVHYYNGSEPYTYVAEAETAGHRYGFAKGETGYSYLNYAYKLDTMEKAEAAVFTDYDSFFDYRGYLWSRSIPLLKKYLILGAGADTFSIVFPQNDYVARINANFQDKLITKPHSLYLQYGIQYGVPGLVCFLVFVGIYVVQTLRLCFKSDFQDVYSCGALGILLGVTGYGIMGIANDSCVALAPLAWLVLGLGFALNIFLENTGKK